MSRSAAHSPAARPIRRVAVVGPGAIGTTLAVRLAAAGYPVSVLDHRPDRAAALSREGLVLRSGKGEQHASVTVETSADRLPEPDLVLVTVKCPALAAAGENLARLRSPAAILTIQNGLDVLPALRRGLGKAAGRHVLLAGVTYQAAGPDADNVVRHVANLPTHLGGWGELRGWAEAIAALFESAGLPARVEADLRSTVWRKLIANAAINPLTTLEGVRNGELVEREDLRRRLLALARETAAVARAEGIDVAGDEAEDLATRAASATAENVSSMRQDVEAGRRTEIEFLGGAILTRAEHHGVDVPETRRVTEAVRRLDARLG